MAYRYFITTFWGDGDILKLTSEEKLIFIYLWTNSRSNQAGLYSIPPETIAYETKISIDKINKSLDLLEKEGKIKRDGEWTWIINFIKHQANRSSTVLQNIATDLSKIESSLVKELLDYYDTLSIPYRYPIDTLSIREDMNKEQGIRNKNKEQGIRNKNKEKEVKITRSKERDPNISILIDFFFQEYYKNFNIKPIVKGGLWGKVFQRILKVYSIDKIKISISEYFSIKDKWIEGQHYSVSAFEHWIESKSIKEIKKEGGKYAGIEKSV